MRTAVRRVGAERVHVRARVDRKVRLLPEVLLKVPLLKEPDARLHLYGKAEARKGRKMGHVTRLTPRSDRR